MNKYIENAKDWVLKVICAENNKPIPIGIVIKKIQDKNKSIKKNDIFKAINLLLNQNYIKKNFYDKLLVDYLDYPVIPNEYYECKISNINNSKNGFLVYFNPETQQEETFFCHHRNLNSCLVNDIVLCQKLFIDENSTNIKNELVHVKVVKLIQRQKTKYTGVVCDNKLIIDDPKFYLDANIVANDLKNYNGYHLFLNLEKIENEIAYFKVIKNLGSVNQKGVDIDSIILDSGFDLQIDSKIKEISEKIDFKVTEKDLKIRRDLRNRNIVSIDPKDSKDMDDAIYVSKLNNEQYLLSVCIADVSYYVKQQSELDIDALKKCTSVYLVDRVLPMLDHNLSNNICSLNQDVDRFCLTCDMVFDKNANLISYELFPSIIRNKHRLSYDEVNLFFENNDNSNFDEELKKQLLISKELFEKIRSKKQKEGYVELKIKEPKIICDENGKPIEITVKESGKAQNMIEDFMVSCNEAVTLIANELKLDFLYRIHPKPDEAKITKFKTELYKLNFLGSELVQDSIDSQTFNKILKINEFNVSYNLLNKLILKSMQKAEYSLNNIGHFGLALDNYTHFTSPIRRYSDLIVHRIFWMFVFDPDSYSADQKRYLIDNLQMYVDECNKQEVKAISLERDVCSYKFAEYMENYINQTFDAQISAITQFGIFVELENTIEGLVSIRSLKDDYYVYDPEKMILIGEKTNFIYTLGMKLKVQLISADKKTRKIDFIIIK